MQYHVADNNDTKFRNSLITLLCIAREVLFSSQQIKFSSQLFYKSVL